MDNQEWQKVLSKLDSLEDRRASAQTTDEDETAMEAIVEAVADLPE